MSTTMTIPPAATGPTGWLPSALYRMTVDEYEAMIATGALDGRRRLHLIDGLLVEKMTQNPPHAIAYAICGHELTRVVPPGWHVRPALPIRLPGQRSEPEPDHCVARGAFRDYLGGHPGPADIAMVVEVADSSLADDRAYASRLYGPAGIPAYWIINLVDRQIEVFTAPGPSGDASCKVFGPGLAVPVVIDGRQVGQIAVDDLLP